MGVDAVIVIIGPDVQENLVGINRRIYDLGIADVDSVYDNRFDEYSPNVAYLKTLWRYWRPGYERGPFHEISLICNLAAIMFPKSKVYYGGDSEMRYDGPYGEYLEWTPMRYIEYLEHLASPNGIDYRNVR